MSTVSVVRFPFDWRNPIGYIAVTAFQYIVILYELFFTGNALAFGFGTFLFIHQLTYCSIRILHLVGQHGKTKEKQPRISIEFAKFIQSHSANKQLVFDASTSCQYILIRKFFRLIFGVSSLAQPLLIIVMICANLLMCASMLWLQKELVS